MGNSPSKEPQGRPPHKLSKTRVVSATTASTLPPSPSHGHPADFLHPHDRSNHLISIPYSEIVCSESPEDNDDQDAHENSDKPSSLIPSKVQRRLSLFRSKSSQETSERRRSRRNTIIGAPSPAPGDSAITRANSVSTHHPVNELPSEFGLSTVERLPPAGNRASWAYDLSSYEAQRILNIVRDQPTTLPRSQTSRSFLELDTEEIRTRASRRVSLPVQPESAPITRSNSEMSLHPPMRRRSLIQTPGVATRTRPSPPSARSVRSSFRHSHPPTPSMSRQPSFDSENDSRFLSLPPLSSTHYDMGQLYRALTPKDTDYSTTGAFKLGTLRITNGSPDLTPNVAAALEAVGEQCISNDNQGDYFSKAPSSEPAIPELSSGSQFSSQVVDLQDSSTSVAKPRTLVLESNTRQISSTTVPDLELQLSEDGLQDSSHSPTLMTQSRLAAVDDHLFDDDSPLEMSVVEVLDVRVDSSAKSVPQLELETAQIGNQGVQRTDSGFVSNTQSDSSQSCNSLAKADSGYSSNVSLRSLRASKKPTALEGESRTSADSDRDSPKVQDQGPSGASNRPIIESIDDEQAPIPPPKDDVVLMKKKPKTHTQIASNSNAAVATEAVTKTRSKSARQLPVDINTVKLQDRSNTSVETSSPTAASMTSETSSSSLSIGNNSQKPGRLQRLLSLRSSTFSKQTLTVHVTHAVDNNRVPSIPKDVEEKLREHTGLFPMTTKRLALKNQMSKETLKTILSVGSLELSRDDEILSPDFRSPGKGERGTALCDNADVKEASLKSTFSSMQSNFRHAAMGVMSSRHPIVRKPVPSRQESHKIHAKDDTILATEAELTSYQSINSTLGNNAYDLAAQALHSPVQFQPNIGPSFRLPSRMALTEDPSVQKGKSSPPVSLNNRGSVRAAPPLSHLNSQGSVALRSKRQVGTSHYGPAPTESRTALQIPQGPRQGRSASGFQYRANSCGPSARRISMDSYRFSPSSSRHNSITSVQSDMVQRSTSVDLKRQTSLDEFYKTQLDAHLAQPAHRGPSNRPGWNHQHRAHPHGGQSGDQHAWLPPYVPRDPHRRNLSAGSRPFNQGAGQAPYRILHSYNSPAYRNAPIWG